MFQESGSGMLRIPHIKKKLKKQHYSSILALGCGPCDYFKDLSADFKLGVELYGPYARYATQFAHVIQADITKLPIKEGARFDLIILSEIIEHLEKSDSVELLKKALIMGNEVIVNTPAQGVLHPGGIDNDPYQCHLCKWDDASEVTNLGYTFIGDTYHGTDSAHFWKKEGEDTVAPIESVDDVICCQADGHDLLKVFLESGDGDCVFICPYCNRIYPRISSLTIILPDDKKGEMVKV